MNRSAIKVGGTGHLLLILGFSLTVMATAAKAQGTPEQRAACTTDALRLCSAEIPDVARVTACMRAKQASLSPRCRAAFLGATARPSYADARAHHFSRRFHHATMFAYHRGRHRHGHRGFGQYGQAMAMAMQVMAGLSQSGFFNGMGGDFMNGGGFTNGGGFMNGSGFAGAGGGFMNSGMSQNLMNSGMMQNFMNSGMAQQFMNSGMAQGLMQSFMR